MITEQQPYESAPVLMWCGHQLRSYHTFQFLKYAAMVVMDHPSSDGSFLFDRKEREAAIVGSIATVQQ